MIIAPAFFAEFFKNPFLFAYCGPVYQVACDLYCLTSDPALLRLIALAIACFAGFVATRKNGNRVKRLLRLRLNFVL